MNERAAFEDAAEVTGRVAHHARNAEGGAESRRRHGRVDVVTLGEAMVLFWPVGGRGLDSASRFGRSIGGAESNVSIALARLGHTPRWISRLGDDPFGRYVRAILEREGVQVDATMDPTAPTAVFFKEQVASGPRRVLYYRRDSAASHLAPVDLGPAQFAGARALHITGITPALSASCAAAIARAIELARSAELLVSVDPNVRLPLWPSERVCQDTLRSLMAHADLVLLGHEDAATLFPGLGEADILDAVRALGPRMAVLKLGERGACAAMGDDRARIEPYPVTAVDSVGAGDGFAAGFLAGVLRGFTLPHSLSLAAHVGAAAVTTAGDWEGYPTAENVGLPPYRTDL